MGSNKQLSNPIQQGALLWRSHARIVALLLKTGAVSAILPMKQRSKNSAEYHRLSFALRREHP
jgi:hypothetical protein